MKQLIHKSIAISMAFVVLFTTMSFTVDMHYCGESMVDFAIFQSPKTCGMEKMSQTAVQPTCKNPVFSQKSCCSDKQIIVQGQDDLKNSFESFSLEQQTFIASFTYSYLSLFNTSEKKEIPFVVYSPPFLRQDIQVLHQIFLI